jgi:hypothetical protein
MEFYPETQIPQVGQQSKFYLSCKSTERKRALHNHNRDMNGGNQNAMS